uniref:J domain-containing protein n=1 Tax=Arcella intermedia TaxID=1963864 RepID=A0A6B2LGS0_9EUKA
MSSANHYECLLLPVSREVVPSVVRKAYKGIALKVHPDKCTSPQAQSAFQALSEAFEVLYDEKTQRAYYEEVVRAPTGAKRRRGDAGRKAKRRKSGGGRRTEAAPVSKSWEEFEEDLRRKKEREEELREEFHSKMKREYAQKAVLRDLKTASAICEQLDVRSGKEEGGDLWPLCDLKGLSEIELAGKLSLLNNHLRLEHCYCYICGIHFHSLTDMQSNCSCTP